MLSFREKHLLHSRIELDVSLLVVHHLLQPEPELLAGIVVQDAIEGALLDANAAIVHQRLWLLWFSGHYH